MVLMQEPIFVLFGHAVAVAVPDRRQGARHKVILLIRAANLDAAATRAVGVALQYGYQHLALEKGDQLYMTAEEAEEEYLKGAIVNAEESGQAIIVYDEELPPNA